MIIPVSWRKHPLLPESGGSTDRGSRGSKDAELSGEAILQHVGRREDRPWTGITVFDYTSHHLSQLLESITIFVGMRVG